MSVDDQGYYEKIDNSSAPFAGSSSTYVTAPVTVPGVVGLIEIDKFVVSGGTIASCYGETHSDGHCVFRTENKYLIAIIETGVCKWCKGARGASTKDSRLQETRIRACLRGIFQLTADKAEKLGELISELVSSQNQVPYLGLPFVGTSPYCTMENITHISGRALTQLLKFDPDFVWGDNLIFSTAVKYPSTHSLS